MAGKKYLTNKEIAEIGRNWLADPSDKRLEAAAERIGLSEYRLRERLREIGFTGVRKKSRSRRGKPW